MFSMKGSPTLDNRLLDIHQLNYSLFFNCNSKWLQYFFQQHEFSLLNFCLCHYIHN